MKKSRLFNKSGFSLIELMVVVAIIGILAAIGIPQYSKFQAKTRQSEAKSSLSTLYTSEISFMGEWNLYTVDLRNIGYGATGTRLRYITGFVPGVACTAYTTSNGAPAEATTLANTYTCGANVNVATATSATFQLTTQVTLNTNSQCTAIAAAATASVGGTTGVSACNSTVGAQTFRAISIGDPNANIQAGSFTDGWTINQAKQLANVTPGIN